MAQKTEIMEERSEVHPKSCAPGRDAMEPPRFREMAAAAAAMDEGTVENMGGREAYQEGKRRTCQAHSRRKRRQRSSEDRRPPQLRIMAMAAAAAAAAMDQ